MLRWLNANKVEYVLIGPAAEAIRGRSDARGPVAIVPEPYKRNFDRLTRALVGSDARIRIDGEPETTPTKLTADKLARGTRWTFRCGKHDIDIERCGGRGANRTPRYQELLYEANQFEIEPGLSVEVASPEDLEHFAQLRTTGTAPEIRITRNPAANAGAPIPPQGPGRLRREEEKAR